jgi:hypothetical protein
MTKNRYIIERPGYLGKTRNAKYVEWDEKFGKGNWELVWLLNGFRYNWLGVCGLYEDAYLVYFESHPDILAQLLTEASDVYDDSLTNVGSGLDYLRQETERTHIQDIAIRRCVDKLGLKFKGDKLIQIRDSLGEHPLSMTLSPGKVPFHHPEHIEVPRIEGWWDAGSVEDFYQSNKYLEAIVDTDSEQWSDL